MAFIGNTILSMSLNDGFFPDVMSGRKSSTIRLARNTADFKNTQYIRFCGSKRVSLSSVVRVRQVREIKVRELTSNEAKTENVSDATALKTLLKEFYNDLSEDTLLRVVEFDPPIDGKIRVTYENIDPKKYQAAVTGVISDIGWGSWTEEFKGVHDLLKLQRTDLDKNVGIEYQASDSDEKNGRLVVQIPATNIDWLYNGVPALLSMIAGSVLGSSYFSGPIENGIRLPGARVADVQLPESVERQFYGPRLGIEGIRSLCDVKERPILAFTVKPRLGLTPNQFARVCVEVAKGGVDIVEDDERLSNQSLNDVFTRARVTLDLLKKAKVRAIYSANITGRSDQIVDVARELIEIGVQMLKIDVLPAGFSALQAVSEYLHRKDLNIGITVFPAMNAVYDRVGRQLILALSRLCGADVIYAGIPPFNEVTRVQDPVQFATAASHHGVLRRPKPFQRTVLPTVSTGIHPMNIGAYAQLLGKNVGFFVGGGIAANPLGLVEGGRVLIKALENAEKDDPHKIFDEKEIKGFGKLFGDFISYAKQPVEVKSTANTIRDL